MNLPHLALGRALWGARGQLGRPMALPVRILFVHHSVTHPTDDPYQDMRTIERIGLERFGRFPYSFCIHPSGATLTGAGGTIGAHTRGYNDTALSVCFIGNYETQLPPTAAIAAFCLLRGDLVDSGLLAGEHTIRPHRSVAQTACPGRHVIDVWDLITDSPPGLFPPGLFPPQEDDMPQPYSIKTENGYAYVLSDGTVIDGLSEGAEGVGAFRAVYESRNANARQVDVVQAAVRRARGIA